MTTAIKNITLAEQDARAYGFSYPTPLSIIEQIHDECTEVLEAINQKESLDRQQEEIGDLIHATIALCFHQGFDIEDTINKASHKFSSRMANLKKITHQEGLSDLNGQSLEYMLKLWQRAKA